MKSYGRRDFLKAMGIGAAAAAVAPDLMAKPEAMYPAGSRINFEIANVPCDWEFPWMFYGEVDLPPYPFCVPDDGPVTHEVLSIDPEGYKVYARSLQMIVREDCHLKDLERFMESWTVSLKGEAGVFFDVPYIALPSGWGIRDFDQMRPPGYFPLFPQIPLGAERLTLAIHGQPFQLTGPFKVFASVSGVCIERGTANAELKSNQLLAGGNE